MGQFIRQLTGVRFVAAFWVVLYHYQPALATAGALFQGVVRKYHFAGAVQTHGTHEYRRHGGSIGTNMTPGRTKLGMKMPGQMGNCRVSVLNQKVAKVIPEQNLVLVYGGVPGARGTVVELRGAVKRRGGHVVAVAPVAKKK